MSRFYSEPEEQSDAELIRTALHLWANYIETGSVVLSVTDAAAQHKPFKALNTGQMKLVVRLRELAEKQKHEG